MLLATSVFLAVLCALLAGSASLHPLLSSLGWTAAVVWTAHVITRWILSVWPQAVVTPNGKAILITGCDTGFGLELAKRLSGKGFRVYACCLSLESDGAKELLQRSQLIRVLEMDVTKHDQVQNTVKKVEADLGDNVLWCVVNNAGVAIFTELEWCSMSIIEHMFQVNVLGAIRVTKAFLPLLRAAKGRVVFMASVAGHVTYPGFISYSMTKHAMVSLSDGLRREMRKWGVLVARIEPGLYKTRIVKSDILTGALDNSWQKTPDAIKEAYGFPYYQDFRGRMQRLVEKARPYLEEVVDCLELAATEVRPKIVYRCLGPVVKIRMWIMSLLPTCLQDTVICHVVQPSHRQLSGNSSSSSSS